MQAGKIGSLISFTRRFDGISFLQPNTIRYHTLPHSLGMGHLIIRMSVSLINLQPIQVALFVTQLIDLWNTQAIIQ